MEKHDLGKMTLRQIGSLIGEEQAQKVRHHLLQLEKRGLIEIDRQRGVMEKVKPDIRVSSRNSSALIAVPILGSANCGPQEIFADNNLEGYLKVSPKILNGKRDVFAIRAVGSSMNRASVQGDAIDDGDYVIIDSADRNPENKDYVVSIIDNLANIKRFFRDGEKQQIILASESTMDYPPICIHEDDADAYCVAGKVLKVIKKTKPIVWTSGKAVSYETAFAGVHIRGRGPSH